MGRGGRAKSWTLASVMFEPLNWGVGGRGGVRDSLMGALLHVEWNGFQEP